MDSLAFTRHLEGAAVVEHFHRISRGQAALLHFRGVQLDARLGELLDPLASLNWLWMR